MRHRLCFIAPVLIVCALATPAHSKVLTFDGTVDGALNGVAFAGTQHATGETINGYMSIDVSGITNPVASNALQWGSMYHSGCIAERVAGALNLLALTNGNFTRTITTNFPTGEVYTGTQVQTRNGSTDFFTLQHHFTGTCPTIPPGTIFAPQDYDDSFQQTSPNTLRYTMVHNFLVDLNNDGVTDPIYTVTGTIDIAYDGAVTLPMDEILHGRAQAVFLNSGAGTLHFDLTSQMTFVPEPAALALLAPFALLLPRRR